MKPLIFSSMTLLFFLAGIPAKSQNFDPEKYKTERERQQNRELQRESDRKRYQEEQRKREKENAPREKIRRTSPAVDNNEPVVVKEKAVPEMPISAFQELPYALPHYRNSLSTETPDPPIREAWAKYEFKNGDSFTGRWKNNTMDSGLYIFKDGDYYKGAISNNEMFDVKGWYKISYKGDSVTHFSAQPPGDSIKYIYHFKNGISMKVSYCYDDRMPLRALYTFANGDTWKVEYELPGTQVGPDKYCNGSGVYRFAKGDTYFTFFKSRVVYSRTLMK